MRALLFDLDRTLIDRDTSAARFFASQASRHGLAEARAGLRAEFVARLLELDNNGLADKAAMYRRIAAEFTLPADAASQGGGMAAAPGVVNYPAGGGYPKLNAPLYPSPQQGTQPWTHGTIITNQALAPHEMLYPHKYHAMYGPFYYRVKGCWVMTPVGMRQHEKWELQGTEVKVNYRSTYAPLSGFHPRFF